MLTVLCEGNEFFIVIAFSFQKSTQNLIDQYFSCLRTTDEQQDFDDSLVTP